tara:strand:- start:9793 stop:10314 length:522 start_codon:yes stop_codon:yes gene_type:complete
MIKIQMSEFPLKFQEEIEKTLDHEGGYVNDPDDTGGETKFGISKRAYPKTDIFRLTRDDAIKIYFRDYWLKYKCDSVPDDLQGILFDMAVNHGGRRAVKIMQQTANAKAGKTGKHISVDGMIGKNTIKALKSVELERVVSYRLLFYAKIILRKPTQEKFWFGWFRRCTDVLKN